MIKNVKTLLLASTALSLMLVGPAYAADDTAQTLKSLQKQVETLQKQLGELQKKQKASEKAQAETAATVAASQPKNVPDGIQKEVLPGVKVTLGGYVETDALWREKNQSNDTTSNLNASIPFDNVANAHQSEFRGTARPSRLSLLAEGNVDKDFKLGAFIESDFMGSGTTSNSVQTNSYVPRLRHAYTTVDRNDWGFHFVAGQTFSLLTLNKEGIKVRNEALPMTIDSALLPGVNYARGPQVRIVKELMEKKVNLGLSAESPQVTFGGIQQPTALQSASQTGGSSLNTSTSYSTDIAPDIIAKVAVDPGFGHYELFGITRFFHNNLVTSFRNKYEVGYGMGGGAYIPVIAKMLDVQGTFMVGEGIGRYGPVQFPDFAFGTDGNIKPVTKYSAMVGVIGRPTPTWDLYVYAGMEHAERVNEPGTFTIGAVNYNYGYGSNSATSLSNAGCYTHGGTCAAQTKTVWGVTPGLWKQLYKGDYGNIKVGAQYSFTHRQAFDDAAGLEPSANENMVFTAFRYSPF